MYVYVPAMYDIEAVSNTLHITIHTLMRLCCIINKYNNLLDIAWRGTTNCLCTVSKILCYAPEFRQLNEKLVEFTNIFKVHLTQNVNLIFKFNQQNSFLQCMGI